MSSIDEILAFSSVFVGAFAFNEQSKWCLLDISASHTIPIQFCGGWILTEIVPTKNSGRIFITKVMSVFEEPIYSTIHAAEQARLHNKVAIADV
ncbi:hypothetical protein [Shewanella khirikhana]|uniref:Uncharacterized protein n=1 Tax=Shewanella khirikhana TaxID=1965282 RepID=A0ABM7D1W7_9GAMM|nr:hypothetical protein [Shewanella khirikhana]AZQ10427.1 hypothetical protein STH12_01305 [Shewanella khirikhana]